MSSTAEKKKKKRLQKVQRGTPWIRNFFEILDCPSNTHLPNMSTLQPPNAEKQKYPTHGPVKKLLQNLR